MKIPGIFLQKSLNIYERYLNKNYLRQKELHKGMTESMVIMKVFSYDFDDAGIVHCSLFEVP